MENIASYIFPESFPLEKVYSLIYREKNSFMDVSLSISGKRSSASTLTRVRRKQSFASAHFSPAAPVNAVRPSATCANAAANAARPAQPAQTPRQMPRDLRNLRKRPGKCRETCATCANTPANAVRLAQPAQTPRQMPRDLRNLRKHPGKSLEIKKGRERMVPDLFTNGNFRRYDPHNA